MDAEEFGKLLQQSRDGNAEAVLAAVDLAGPGLLSRADADGWRLLNYAVLEGHVELVRGLLSRGSDVDAKDEHDETVLSIAVWDANLELTEVLLDFGADPDSANEEGPVLHIAARWDRPELCRLLVSKGADLMRVFRGNTALCEYGHRVHLEEEAKNVARDTLLEAFLNGPHPSQVLLRLRNGNWARRWPLMCVVASCGYRPLEAARLALLATAVDPSAKIEPIVLDTADKRLAYVLGIVLANDGLLRRIMAFL